MDGQTDTKTTPRTVTPCTPVALRLVVQEGMQDNVKGILSGDHRTMPGNKVTKYRNVIDLFRSIEWNNQ